MSSSRFVLQPTSNGKMQSQVAMPDYAGLVKFLVQPFLESKHSLKVDCEISASRPRVWIRLAFEGEDKGRVFGRGALRRGSSVVHPMAVTTVQVAKEYSRGAEESRFEMIAR